MPRTYVNNAFNRAYGRVGMPHGTRIVSRDAYRDSDSDSFSGEDGDPYNSIVYYSDPDYEEHDEYSYSDNVLTLSTCTMPRTYVNNAFNRAYGRVGMPHGTRIVSRDAYRDSDSDSFSGEDGDPYDSIVYYSDPDYEEHDEYSYSDNSCIKFYAAFSNALQNLAVWLSWSSLRFPFWTCLVLWSWPISLAHLVYNIREHVHLKYGWIFVVSSSVWFLFTYLFVFEFLYILILGPVGCLFLLFIRAGIALAVFKDMKYLSYVIGVFLFTHLSAFFALKLVSRSFSEYFK